MNQTLSKLQPGMTVRFDGRPHRVVMVNECRARIVPLEKRVRVLVPQIGAQAGQVVRFTEQPQGHNISPNSELEVIPR